VSPHYPYIHIESIDSMIRFAKICHPVWTSPSGGGGGIKERKTLYSQRIFRDVFGLSLGRAWASPTLA